MSEGKRPCDSSELADLTERVARVEARLQDLRARLPAHSLPPAMQWQLEELEAELAELLRRSQSMN